MPRLRDTLARLAVAAAVSGSAACGQAVGGGPDADAPTGDASSAEAASDAPGAAALADSPGPAADTTADATNTIDSTAIWVDAAADVTLSVADVPAPNDGDASGPATCFSGAPPAADAWVADVPKPAQPCPEMAPPAWFDGVAVPKPSLKLQVGWRDSAGAWHPYQDGDWVPLQKGSQGLFHLDLVPVVQLPSGMAALTALQVQSIALYGCNDVATLGSPKAKFYADKQQPSQYTIGPSDHLMTVFGVVQAEMPKYCGLWVHVWWRVRIPDTDQWGEVVLALRTFISSAPPLQVGG